MSDSEPSSLRILVTGCAGKVGSASAWERGAQKHVATCRTTPDVDAAELFQFCRTRRGLPCHAPRFDHGLRGGHHTLFVVDRRNGLALPAELLARLLYADVAPRCELLGNQALVDWRRATDLLSFDSQISATQVMEP